MKSADFKSLMDEFEAASAAVAPDRARDMEVVFQEFTHAYQQARQTRASFTPHLNVLDVFGLNTRELRHSSVLAWLLRADAEHEQGGRFMGALLRLLGFPPPKDENYTVHLEKPDRVDIAVIANGEFAVFIENKVFAGEQETQFERLIDSLTAHADAFGIPWQQRAAVFLTNDGRKPTTMPDAVHPSVRTFCIRRDVVINSFAKALAESPAKSPLLENLMDSYRRGISTLD